MRTDAREPEGLRPVTITPNYTEMAAGSALIACGKTRVLCTASVSEGVPPFLKGTGRGWLTAEYAMLPGATPQRKPREYAKRDGRSVEIQRLIGRSLRTAVDMSMLGERTVTIDCDVLQADGGTRTASITGGFVALCLAVDKLLKAGQLKDSPIVRQVAAVSCGLVKGEALLDLEYIEDSAAQADMNIVAARGRDGELAFTEAQITGEKRTVRREELLRLLDMGTRGVETLMELQREALGEAAALISRKPMLIAATNNFGKLRELRAMLENRFDVRSMREAGIAVEVEETGETFEENALLKARAIARAAGCPAIADDSGLTVDALGSAPGVYSARYAGVHGDDAANNAKLLKALEGRSGDERRARFVCAVALVWPDGRERTAFGECRGTILSEGRGEGGFGYDPLFLSDELGATFGEAEQAEKDKVSHRARAVQALLRALEEEEP